MEFKSIILSGLPGSGKSVLTARLLNYYGFRKLFFGDNWRALWKEKYPNQEVEFDEYWKKLLMKIILG